MTPHGPSRRQLFLGTFTEKGSSAIRPPGSDPESFAELCNSCDLCVETCPEGIISADKEGRAELSFADGECTFCGACVEACPTGALAEDRVPTWPWRATISENCLSLNGITCRSCQDSCDARAIRFQLAVGGTAKPLLDSNTCTGCGACVSVCPVDAVSMQQIRPQVLEAAE